MPFAIWDLKATGLISCGNYLFSPIRYLIIEVTRFATFFSGFDQLSIFYFIFLFFSIALCAKKYGELSIYH